MGKKYRTVLENRMRDRVKKGRTTDRGQIHRQLAVAIIVTPALVKGNPITQRE